MGTWGQVVVAVVAIALLVGAVLAYRRGPLPWPAIGLAALTSAVCFTVGGTGDDQPGPTPATVLASIVGLVALISAILALVPRASSSPASRVPLLLSAGGTAVGALGLLVTRLG